MYFWSVSSLIKLLIEMRQAQVPLSLLLAFREGDAKHGRPVPPSSRFMAAFSVSPFFNLAVRDAVREDRAPAAFQLRAAVLAAGSQDGGVGGWRGAALVPQRG